MSESESKSGSELKLKLKLKFAADPKQGHGLDTDLMLESGLGVKPWV